MAPNISEFIDLAGELNEDIKSKKKDLDKLKAVIRKSVKEGQLAKDYGETWIVKATEHVTSKVDIPASVNAYIGVKMNQISPDEDIVISGRDLVMFLDAISITVTNIRRDFTEESAENLLDIKAQPFHTLSFERADQE